MSRGLCDPVERCVEGDTVAARFTMRGTHDGEFFGIPASGNRISVQAMNFYYLADGRIIGERARPDLLGVMQPHDLGQGPHPDIAQAQAASPRRDSRRFRMWGQPLPMPAYACRPIGESRSKSAWVRTRRVPWPSGCSVQVMVVSSEPSANR